MARYGTGLFLTDGEELCQMVQHGVRRCRLVHDDVRYVGWYRLVSDGTEWCAMVQYGTGRCRMVYDDARWYRMVPYGVI